jgi:hypothetical protein
MGKEDIINKTEIYTFEIDKADQYTYNVNHGTEYPFNGLPTGMHGRKYKKTRFIRWQPKPEDIVMRHYGSQIIVNFTALFPNDVLDPNCQIFKLRSKRVDLQNLICEQINFFTALYDQDNDLLTSMCVAKYVTDSQDYTMATFEEYSDRLISILFPDKTIEKIRLMVRDNDVGDDTIGLFPVEFLEDAFILSFMMKVMHIFIEHFIISTGNSPKTLFESFAKAYTKIMKMLNPKMYLVLYDYVQKSVNQCITSNSNIVDMQAIEGVTAPTIAQSIMRKSLLCDGLIKLTFASEWDPYLKRPIHSCVGLIKAIVGHATNVIRKVQLRFTFISVDDVSQLQTDNISSSSPISMIRSFNPGEFTCMRRDLNMIIGHAIMETDLTPLNWYMENLPKMNELASMLIRIVLYNKFHSSISLSTISTEQKFILLLYVRSMIMRIYNLNEEDTVSNDLINLLMGKATSESSKTLSQKDISNIKKYVTNDGSITRYLLSEASGDALSESIMHVVLSSFTIVNHNDPSSLGAELFYEPYLMTTRVIDMISELFATF